MKKLLSMLVLATLILSGGLAHAISIPQSEDPNNNGGPAQWLVPVYNNSGVSLAAGDVVVWDIGNSTGDTANYVTTTTTADTNIVAGVVYRDNIPAGATGSIVVHGVTTVSMLGAGQTVGGLVCSSGTAKKAINCGTNANAFGIVVTATSSGYANVFVKGVN